MNTMSTYKEELLDVGNSCSHNSSDDKACHKPRGGESCAYDGSYIVLNPIRNAAHLVHGPIACAGHNYESRGSLSSGSNLYRYGFTTDLQNMDVIYGGEKKLHDAIVYIANEFKPAAVFVYNTCVPALTGEDVEKVCEDSSREIGLPVIPVIAPGFLGHKNLGNRIAGETLLKYVIGTGEPAEDVTNIPTINFIGEYNIAGETWDLLPLYEKIGVRVLSRMTGDSDYHEITYAHRAKANLLVCGRALINVAVGMEESYEIPYSEVSFFGISNTSNALRESAKLLKDKGFDIATKTEELIFKEEKRARELLEPYMDLLSGKKAVIYTGGVKSWSFISMLRDLGIEVTGVGTKKSSLVDMERIKALVGEGAMIEKPTPKTLLTRMEESGAEILIAGGRNQYFAYKQYLPFLDVNQEKHTPYAGYEGIVRFADDLLKTMQTPVWDAVKRRAPWE